MSLKKETISLIFLRSYTQTTTDRLRRRRRPEQPCFPFLFYDSRSLLFWLPFHESGRSVHLGEDRGLELATVWSSSSPPRSPYYSPEAIIFLEFSLSNRVERRDDRVKCMMTGPQKSRNFPLIWKFLYDEDGKVQNTRSKYKKNGTI